MWFIRMIEVLEFSYLDKYILLMTTMFKIDMYHFFVRNRYHISMHIKILDNHIISCSWYWIITRGLEFEKLSSNIYIGAIHIAFIWSTYLLASTYYQFSFMKSRRKLVVIRPKQTTHQDFHSQKVALLYH